MRARRMSQIAKAGSKMASRAAWSKAQAIFSSQAPGSMIDRSREIRSAQDVARELGSMRGVMAKFGQMLSYVSTPLDPQIRAGFADLQDNAPPMSNDLVSQVFSQEFGSLPEDIFAQWDPDPIASASIGQVHRAITHSGVAVAVKVQYPGIGATLKADLANLRLVARGFRFAFPSMDTNSIVAEISERIVEELDYRKEAQNQNAFSEFYRGHPFIKIPRVLPQYCTSKVLATELGSGVRFGEFVKSDQNAKDLAGETIFRFVFRSLYQMRSFNGDPHPGNFLFNGDSTVTFLDFGLTKHFAAAEIDRFELIISSMVIRKNPAEFRNAIEEAGLLDLDCRLPDNEIFHHFEPFYESVIQDAQFTFDDEYTTRLFAHAFDQKSAIAKYLKVSPPFVVIQRINLGLYSILAALGATANFRKIAEEIWPFTLGKATTKLGLQERDWLNTKDQIR